ncbi:cell division inhibition protein DicB, partial [Escherichia coli]
MEKLSCNASTSELRFEIGVITGDK